MPHGRGYGCIPDDPYDKGPKGRDYRFTLAPPSEIIVPDAHDLTMIPQFRMDQGALGTCASHAGSAAYRYELANNDLPDVPISRAMLDWESGVLEGDTSTNGRQIRDILKVMAKGVAKESLWGYDKVGQQPPPDAYTDAPNQMILEYQRVDVDRAAINQAIYLGHPILVGFEVFPAFETDEVAATGIVPMPKFGQTPISAHAVLQLGYDPQWDIEMNWWGEWFGLPEKKWFFKLPRGYLEKYGSDFWTVFYAQRSTS